MVIHEYVLKKGCIICGDRSRENGKEFPFVTGILVDIVSVVASLDNVMDGVGSIISFPPWHVIRALLPSATCHHSGI